MTKIKKGIKGLVLALLFIGGFSLIEPSVWFQSKIIILIVITVLASIYQPSYNPFKVAKDKKDRGSALQIIWTVYIGQFLALLEAVLFNYQDSMKWSWVSALAVVAAFMGLYLRSWAYKELGDFFTWHINVEPDQKVVKTGPYKIVVHPSYTGALMTYFFTCIFLHSFYAAVINFGLLFFCFYRRILFEEIEMIKELGDEYKEFCHSKKKLIPFIW